VGVSARKRWLRNFDDQVLPASPGSRRVAAAAGCLTLVVLLALLVWFIATHTQTFDNPPIYGR
jgi:hypothetical protein